MPQRERITWAQLRVGTMVIASLAILVLGIFFISGQIGFLRRRYTVKAYFSSASGLRLGAQVRLAGIAVGNVERLLISPYPERERAVEVVMHVTRAYQDQIRADSTATLETEGLLGESYVEITRGGPGQPIIPDGGQVKGGEQADIKRVVQNANDVISNLRVLSAKLNDITAEIESSKGSLGKLIYDPGLYNRLNQTTETVQRLVNRVAGGEGSLGKLVTDDTLYKRSVATLDRVNQVLDDVQHGKGSLAKFISDPSVYDNVKGLVSRANTLMDNVNQGQGTLGKLVTDPQLYNRMNDTFDRLNTVTTHVEQGQGTLGKLYTDATLYNNLNESLQIVRDFLRDFKKSPKKFLTIKVRLF
jgi:phospholipid/cholesterol/gamma-HCH transport system substrate-binding protein